MLVHRPIAQVLNQFRTCSEPWVPRALSLLEETESANAHVRVNVVPAVELRAVYSVRLDAWRHRRGPRTENFDPFVSELDHPGIVEFFAVRDAVSRWVFLSREGDLVSYLRIYDDEHRKCPPPGEAK